MLDLPEPLGPTMAVIPWPKSKTVRAANDLKPVSSRRFRYTAPVLSRRCQGLQSLPRCVQFRLFLVASLTAAQDLVPH